MPSKQSQHSTKHLTGPRTCPPLAIWNRFSVVSYTIDNRSMLVSMPVIYPAWHEAYRADYEINPILAIVALFTTTLL